MAPFAKCILATWLSGVFHNGFATTALPNRQTDEPRGWHQRLILTLGPAFLEMEVIFLGTASAYPTPTRCVSCTAIRYTNSKFRQLCTQLAVLIVCNCCLTVETNIWSVYCLLLFYVLRITGVWLFDVECDVRFNLTYITATAGATQCHIVTPNSTLYRQLELHLSKSCHSLEPPRQQHSPLST